MPIDQLLAWMTSNIGGERNLTAPLNTPLTSSAWRSTHTTTNRWATPPHIHTHTFVAFHSYVVLLHIYFSRVVLICYLSWFHDDQSDLWHSALFPNLPLDPAHSSLLARECKNKAVKIFMKCLE